MYLITIDGKEEEGVYSVTNEYGVSVLYIFEEEDDAVRFAMLLEQDGNPRMSVIEVEEDLIIRACQIHDYEYQVFTSDDLVIPPSKDYISFI